MSTIYIIHIAENNKINLIFGYEDSMELFTTIIILNYEIDDTRDSTTLVLRLIDTHIRLCKLEGSDPSNINLNF